MSYSACERCTARGQWVGRVVFNYQASHSTEIESDELHTDEKFHHMMYKDHQTTCTPLINHGVACTSTFVLDYMHLVCLGVVRRFLRFLQVGPKLCRISFRQQSEISDNLLAFRDYIPSDFVRKPRSLQNLDRW